MGQRYVFGTDRGTDRQRLKSEVKKKRNFFLIKTSSPGRTNGQTDERTNGRTNGRTNRRTDGRTNGRTERQTDIQLQSC